MSGRVRPRLSCRSGTVCRAFGSAPVAGISAPPDSLAADIELLDRRNWHLGANGQRRSLPGRSINPFHSAWFEPDTTRTRPRPDPNSIQTRTRTPVGSARLCPSQTDPNSVRTRPGLGTGRVVSSHLSRLGPVQLGSARRGGSRTGRIIYVRGARRRPWPIRCALPLGDRCSPARWRPEGRPDTTGVSVGRSRR